MIPRLYSTLSTYKAHYSFVLAHSHHVFLNIFFPFWLIEGVSLKNQFFVSIVQSKVNQAPTSIIFGLHFVKHTYVPNRLVLFNWFADWRLYFILKISNHSIWQPKVKNCPPVRLIHLRKLQRLWMAFRSLNYLLYL